jgi:hypothetical protein
MLEIICIGLFLLLVIATLGLIKVLESLQEKKP